MICQGVAMLLSAVLGIVTLAGALTAELLVALSFFGGVVIGFNQSSRLALVSGLLPPVRLTTAVAIISILFHRSRFIWLAVACLLLVCGALVDCLVRLF